MLKGKDMLSIHDLSVDEVQEILALAKELKAKQKAGVPHKILEGKTLGMIFEKSSTRTRVSFETGMYQLGGQALFLSNRDLQLGRGEPIRDTARVLSRYLDGIMIRTFGHDRVEELAKWADIPVINALTDLLHPCQVLTDLLTIEEYKGKNLKGLKMAYVGDGNNMTNSFLYGCAKVGMTFVAATPEDYRPDATVFKNALEDAKETGASLSLVTDPHEAVKDADIVVTDTWASMGQEAEHEARKKIFAPYQVNKELLEGADKRVIVMHCLPAYRGEEITEEVLEANADVIFDEAENRLHTQKAIMALTMAD
ncbi:ornithine carbamoyltransferase [Mitsuokella jalaludinii]|uniref:Ornithine carbamoyltransferase n=1 Tax=Mitsuokella jalaludinii TaxID=187979 RepID=A0A173XNH8_9FIRM|nr:ornithine carbamoyltransferase [Mitsuokella jalaludinii]MCQ1533174.1 ornithine carbamoyltransferase [Mitsuokella jalaludinii]MDY5363892.1 ornithine carbamoyltransferase [Mitsuokella jalaludinii]MEE0480652.1 ornithine carbamoyltransferase [Mitsuokella jalaludinii]CUN53284.1 Ornithine carbamoyltransferase [Mitsuokella jalaludinii]